MELSFFLAKLLGIYLLVISCIWLFRSKEFQSSIKETLNTPSVIAMQGILALILGIAIVIDHSIWEFNWRGLITVLGYLMIIKGIIRLGFPKEEKKMGLFILAHKFWVIPMIIIIGLYLTISGFIG